jgi:hypothetical protein
MSESNSIAARRAALFFVRTRAIAASSARMALKNVLRSRLKLMPLLDKHDAMTPIPGSAGPYTRSNSLN